MYGGLGMSAPSLHRESTDSCRFENACLLNNASQPICMHMYKQFSFNCETIHNSQSLSYAFKTRPTLYKHAELSHETTGNRI